MADLVQLRLLGPLVLERADHLPQNLASRKAQALLAYLVRCRQPVPRSQLANLFWSDTSDKRGRRNLTRELSQCVAHLPGCIHAEYHSVQWVAGTGVWVDVDAFAELVARATNKAAHQAEAPRVTPLPSDRWFASSGTISLQPAPLAEAVALYRGEFMAGMYLDGCPEFEAWLIHEREFWRRQIAELLEKLVTHYALRHEDQLALAHARRWIDLEPWQEDAHRYLMVLLARSGHRSAALKQYDICRRILAAELAVTPAAETVALHKQICAETLSREYGIT